MEEIKNLIDSIKTLAETINGFMNTFFDDGLVTVFWAMCGVFAVIVIVRLIKNFIPTS